MSPIAWYTARVHANPVLVIGRDIAGGVAIVACLIAVRACRDGHAAELRIQANEASLAAQVAENSALRTAHVSDSIALSQMAAHMAVLDAGNHRDSAFNASVTKALAGNHPAAIFKLWEGWK